VGNLSHRSLQANTRALGGILMFHKCWKPRHWSSLRWSALIERCEADSALPFWKDKSLYHTEASSFNNRHNHFDRRHLLNRSKSLILSPPAALRWQIDSQATHLILLWSWLPFHNEALCIAVSDLRKDLLGSTVEGEKVKGKSITGCHILDLLGFEPMGKPRNLNGREPNWQWRKCSLVKNHQIH